MELIAPPPAALLDPEPLSPFVAWQAEVRSPFPEALLVRRREPSLLDALTRDPDEAARRLLLPEESHRFVVGALTVLVGSATAFAMVAAELRHAAHPLGAGLAFAANLLLALGAAVGPIHAAMVLMAARIPLSRLIAVLVGGLAAGGLLLLGFTPAVLAMQSLDDQLLGPAAIVGATLLAALRSGLQVHGVLLRLAERCLQSATGEAKAVLAERDAFRVGVVARISMMVLAFTASLALWGMGVLS